MARLKKRYSIPLILLFCTLIVLLYASFQSYRYPSHVELAQKSKYLARIIQSPIDDHSDIYHLKHQNEEWMLFTLSFSTFALTNMAYLDSSFTSSAATLIDTAIQQAMTEPIYHRYSSHNPLSPEIDTNGSILYFGHLNMMLGCYRKLTTNPKYNDLSNRLSACIYNQYTRSDYRNLESYPQKIWIPDNAAGIASLYLHSQITGSAYSRMCAEWVKAARERYTDPETGLLYSTVDYSTGKALEEPRGSMIGWSIFFIYRFDKGFARELYEKYKDTFSTNLIALRLYNERKHVNSTNLGDLDSGPILWGYSIPAAAFAFGDAVAMQDWHEAEKLHRLVSIGSKLVQNGDEMRYQPRIGDLNFSPLAESLGLYFETMTEWKR